MTINHAQKNLYTRAKIQLPQYFQILFGFTESFSSSTHILHRSHEISKSEKGGTADSSKENRNDRDQLQKRSEKQSDMKIRTLTAKNHLNHSKRL